MSKFKISATWRAFIEKRAHFRCEYCLSPMLIATQKLEIEHIIPISLGGLTLLLNLALACRGCNNHKHSRIKAYDDISKRIVRLFNPRKDKWKKHFAWHTDPIYMVGLTPDGRATIEALKLNRPELLTVRSFLLKVQLHPPFHK